MSTSACNEDQLAWRDFSPALPPPPPSLTRRGHRRRDDIKRRKARYEANRVLVEKKCAVARISVEYRRFTRARIRKRRNGATTIQRTWRGFTARKVRERTRASPPPPTPVRAPARGAMSSWAWRPACRPRQSKRFARVTPCARRPGQKLLSWLASRTIQYYVRRRLQRVAHYRQQLLHVAVLTVGAAPPFPPGTTHRCAAGVMPVAPLPLHTQIQRRFLWRQSWRADKLCAIAHEAMVASRTREIRIFEAKRAAKMQRQCVLARPRLGLRPSRPAQPLGRRSGRTPPRACHWPR